MPAKKSQPAQVLDGIYRRGVDRGRRLEGADIDMCFSIMGNATRASRSEEAPIRLESIYT